MLFFKSFHLSVLSVSNSNWISLNAICRRVVFERRQFAESGCRLSGTNPLTQEKIMVTQQKKILVLADGSERSLQTVQYVAEFLPPTGLKVVLFHVFDHIPEYYWDLDKEPKNIEVGSQLRSWERQKKKDINVCKFMNISGR